MGWRLKNKSATHFAVFRKRETTNRCVAAQLIRRRLLPRNILTFLHKRAIQRLLKIILTYWIFISYTFPRVPNPTLLSPFSLILESCPCLQHGRCGESVLSHHVCRSVKSVLKLRSVGLHSLQIANLQLSRKLRAVGEAFKCVNSGLLHGEWIWWVRK